MGSNRDGQLGLSAGLIYHKSSPTLVESLSKLIITDVTCGAFHTLCMTKDH
jgi:alpha-tubulin suppressor-like RCC1 family protein